MNKFGRFSTCVCILLFAATAYSQSEVSDLKAEQQAHVEWLKQFLIFLESSEHAHFRTAAAIQLVYKNDAESVSKGRDIIEEVLSQPVPDLVSLWTIASYCKDNETEIWCQSGRAYALIVEKGSG